MLSTEMNERLNPTIMGSWPELKPRVQRSTNWASQEPLNIFPKTFPRGKNSKFGVYDPYLFNTLTTFECPLKPHLILLHTFLKYMLIEKTTACVMHMMMQGLLDMYKIEKTSIFSSTIMFLCLHFFNVFIYLRERGGRGRGEREFWAGSVLSTQSLMRVQTHKPWDRDLNQNRGGH